MFRSKSQFLLSVVLWGLLAAAVVAGSPSAPESLLFVGETAASAKAMLLNVPTSVPVLRSATRETSYTAGVDFEWMPGAREVRLLAGSRVPFVTPDQLHPEPNSPHAYRHLRNSEKWMLYGPGRYFHDLQCVAEYEAADDWRPPVIEPASEAALGMLRARLKQQQPVKVVMLGDSISTELDCSALASAPPLQPGYPTLVTHSLHHEFGGEVQLVNLSVSGKDSAWGVTQVEAVLAARPQLLLIAFGMNDASGRRTPEDFSALTQKIVEPVLAALPDCEIVLVTSMTGNSEWAFAAPELYGRYAEALRALRGERLAVADVTTHWLAIEARKKCLDLTGNGLNHPNDYGHRLYAEVILGTIGDSQWLSIPGPPAAEK